MGWISFRGKLVFGVYSTLYFVLCALYFVLCILCFVLRSDLLTQRQSTKIKAQRTKIKEPRSVLTLCSPRQNTNPSPRQTHPSQLSSSVFAILWLAQFFASSFWNRL